MARDGHDFAERVWNVIASNIAIGNPNEEGPAHNLSDPEQHGSFYQLAGDGFL